MTAVFDQEKAAQLFAAMTEQAEPVAEALLLTIQKMQPMPSPLVTAVACRYVALYCAHCLFQGVQSEPDKSVLREAFLELDSLTNVDELIAGNVKINDGIVTDLMGGTRLPGGVLPKTGEDPTVFDLDSWEEKPK